MMIFIITFSVLSLDQLSKFLIVKYLSVGQSIPLIREVLHLTLVHNRGAAFGILRNQVPFFIFTSILVVALIFFSLKGSKHKKIYTAGLSLILAGALGNLSDRVFLGYVVDFLDFRVWPVFNVADSAITIGAILLGWNILFKDKCQSTNDKS